MNKASISIGLGEFIFVVLFILKLTGQIDMNWFWVITSFIWVPILIFLTAIATVFVFGVIIVFLAALLGSK